jgi:hypothetical protein
VHFGPKRDDVTGKWRRLLNKKLYDLYCSPNIIWVIKSRRKRRVGHVAHMRERGDDKNVVVGKPEAKRPLGRPRQRWDNIKINLQKVR